MPLTPDRWLVAPSFALLRGGRLTPVLLLALLFGLYGRVGQEVLNLAVVDGIELALIRLDRVEAVTAVGVVVHAIAGQQRVVAGPPLASRADPSVVISIRSFPLRPSTSTTATDAPGIPVSFVADRSLVSMNA